MTSVPTLVQGLARGAVAALHAAMQRALLTAAAVLFGTLGAGFLLFAGFLGLRFLMGPGLAALTLAVVLLAMTVVLLIMARPIQRVPAPTTAPPALTPSTPAPAETAGAVVFTAAFLLGRHLADRWRLPRTP